MSFHPKKRFGQNFLRDQGVADRIVAAAEIGPEDRVLEIGPGLGVLTDRLLTRGADLRVMELDRELAQRLRERQAPRLTVLEGDALRLDWETLLPAPPYTLVANLPYNISSQIVFRILDHRHLFRRLVLMFQKEVGDRLCAATGTKDYGILSVFCQVWFSIRRLTVVPPGAFFPPPKVTSVVLLFEPLSTPRVTIRDEAHFRRVVKGAFAHRRKNILNSLSTFGFPPPATLGALQRAGIDPGRRGETLALEEFARLAETLTADVLPTLPRSPTM